MSGQRALVDCVVLSLQDHCVFYPSCKNCFSRINEDQRDATRFRCSKCGSRCLRNQVEFRYRLSVKVNRDALIFGVTVFGSCLNQFFGISATGLKRLVENSDGPVEASTRSTLLIKSVKDCFIGRHFIFGIKVPRTDAGLLFGSNSKETVHYVASQMILPSASGVRGCTVVSYYRGLLQKTLDYELRSNDPNETRNRRVETTLRLIPPRSPADSFNITWFNSSFLSRSLQRSQSQGCSLSPTPPWQQSLGLVTSSAEQEEGCGSQDDEDERSQRTDNDKTLQQVQRGSAGTEKAPSPRVSSNSPVGNLDTWFSPSQSGNKPEAPLQHETGEFSTRELTKMSLVWEDLPFSESLSEFLCEEYKDEDVVSKTTKDQNETIKSQDESLLDESPQATESRSQVSLDVTNTPATHNKRGDGQDLSDPVNKSRSRSVCFQQEETSLSPGTREEEEKTYDCSVDLFSNSPVIDTDTLNTETQTVKTNSHKRQLKREKADVSYSTPDKLRLKSHKRLNRDGLITPGLQDLDFIPPSQSTPLVNVQHTSWTLNEFSRSSVQSRTSSHDHRFTPRRRFLKPVKQQLKVQTAALNLDDSKSDSSVRDQTVNDVIVAPTPVTKTSGGEKLRRRVQTTTCSLDLTWTEAVNCRRNLLHHHHHHHHPSALQTQTGKCDSETVDLDSSQDDENLDCDWSRDLFSDST